MAGGIYCSCKPVAVLLKSLVLRHGLARNISVVTRIGLQVVRHEFAADPERSALGRKFQQAIFGIVRPQREMLQHPILPESTSCRIGHLFDKPRQHDNVMSGKKAHSCFRIGPELCSFTSTGPGCKPNLTASFGRQFHHRNRTRIAFTIHRSHRNHLTRIQQCSSLTDHFIFCIHKLIPLINYQLSTW